MKICVHLMNALYPHFGFGNIVKNQTGFHFSNLMFCEFLFNDEYLTFNLWHGLFRKG